MDDTIIKDNFKTPVYKCPKCKNKTLYPINKEVPNIDDLCICDECGAELLAKPQFNGTMEFIEDNIEE